MADYVLVEAAQTALFLSKGWVRRPQRYRWGKTKLQTQEEWTRKCGKKEKKENSKETVRYLTNCTHRKLEIKSLKTLPRTSGLSILALCLSARFRVNVRNPCSHQRSTQTI